MKILAATIVMIGMLGQIRPAARPSPAAVVPLCAGLTIVTAISEPAGDYESIKTIQSITPAAVTMTYSAEVPPRSGASERSRVRHVRSTRVIAAADLASANRYARMFADAMPDRLPGTTALGTSAAVLKLLKTTGEAELAVPDEGPIAMVQRASAGRIAANDFRYAAETIRREGTGHVNLPVVVNDVRVELPAIHARGEFFGEPAEFFFLDDVNNPIALRYAVARGEFSDLFDAIASLAADERAEEEDTRDILRVVNISYRCEARPSAPGSGGAPALEKALTETGRVDVYSIFFSFNSDQIREESDATIGEIAAVLARQPGWRLSIGGHTDDIGGVEQNLDLSRRRAAAVKDVLVRKHRIDANRLTTAGHGESQPRDTNGTLEGRARNRRVELVRLP